MNIEDSKIFELSDKDEEKLLENKTEDRIVFDGKILEVHDDRVMLSDGTCGHREIVRHSGGAAVLLVLNKKIFLVNQFRYAYGKTIWEIPAGKREKNEKPIVTAARELEEESGYAAERLIFLGQVYPSPGYTDEVIDLFLCDQATCVGKHPDAQEFLQTCWISEESLEQLILEDQIKDAKTQIAYLKYKWIRGKI